MKVIITKAIGLSFHNTWKQFRYKNKHKTLKMNVLKYINRKSMPKSQINVNYTLLVKKITYNTS
jgi:hypothetical protein